MKEDFFNLNYQAPTFIFKILIHLNSVRKVMLRSAAKL